MAAGVQVGVLGRAQLVQPGGRAVVRASTVMSTRSPAVAKKSGARTDRTSVRSAASCRWAMRDAEITVPAMNAPKIGSMPNDAVVTAPAKMMTTAAATVGPGSSARVVAVST